MAIQINYDTNYQAETPTLVLTYRNGDKIGLIDNIESIKVSDNLNDTPEISFTLHKFNNGVVCNLWNEVKDLRLVWCKEWNTFFNITVSYEDSEQVVKTVQLTRLPESELSQINVYNLEVNTEADIEREDYDAENPTVIYNSTYTNRSLIHRVMENAPHYIIKHCDSSIAGLVRSFSFDGDDIKSCLDSIAEEIHCYIDYEAYYDSSGNLVRAISLYDLESNCLNPECPYFVENNKGYRGEFTDKCPHCNSDLITEGYGEDTNIFISRDSLADSITFETDVDSVKNCFRLVAGDDLMTETIVNCNPNGSRYLWYFSDEMKADMPQALVEKLEDYDELYQEYYGEHEYSVPSAVRTVYNNLITKYSTYNNELTSLPQTIVGYANLIKEYYNTIDFALYLQSSLLPSWQMSDTSASAQASGITSAVVSPVAVTNLTYISSSTADSTVLNFVKLLVDKRYQVKINASSFNSETKVWQGSFKITNYSDDEDTATTDTISVTITDDYETYVNYKIKNALNDYVNSENKYDIGSLFNMSVSDFTNELKKYSLNHLIIFRDACQAVINTLTEQGVADDDMWSGTSSDLYTNLYVPYYQKQQALMAETALRSSEIVKVLGMYWDTDTNDMTEIEYNDFIKDIKALKTANPTQYGVQRFIEDDVLATQSALNFENYIGMELWLQFCAFRREDVYQNDNYISEGLDTATLFKNALEFLERANKDIYKSATLQHTISTTLKNLLVMPEFAVLVSKFKCGNWLRIQVEDEIYKLRLLSYEIDYDDLDNISVTFSDVIKVKDGYTDVESILKQASSMASSYGNVTRQASKGNDSKAYMDKWFSDGLDLTKLKILNKAENQDQVIDKQGILCRAWLNEVDQFDPIQLRIINGTVAITDDNWQTVKAAMGRFVYKDPADSYKIKYGYGINGEVVVGKLIIGNQLGIYNSGGSMSFDNSGLVITGNKNRVKFTPSSDNSVITIKKMSSGSEGNTIFSLDSNGDLDLSGKISASAGSTFGNWTVGSSAIYYGNQNYKNASGMYFGTSGLSLSDKFYVSSAGAATATNLTITGGSLNINNAFKVSSAGILEATGADISGKLTAGSGSIIGEWTITNGRIEKDFTSQSGYRSGMQAVNTSTGSAAFYAGCSTSAGGSIASLQYSNFYVTQAGKLHCRNAVIAENIYMRDQAVGTADTDNHKVFDYASNTLGIYGSVEMYGSVEFQSSAWFAGNTFRAYVNTNLSPDTGVLSPYNNGDGYLGTSGYRWHSVYCSDGAFNGSDRKIKNHIKYLSDENSLEDFIMGLKPVMYTLKAGEGHRHHLGFYAQDVSQIANSTIGDVAIYQATVISRNEKGEIIEGYYDPNVDDEYLSWVMNYNELSAPTIAVVQNLVRRVRQLEQQLNNQSNNTISA